MAQPSAKFGGSSVHSSPHDGINRLPDELLVDILRRHITSEHVRRNASLRSVCRRWKILVDSTAILWSKIRLGPSGLPSSIRACQRLASFCINRSGNCPLDIDLAFSSIDDAADPLEVLNLVTTLVDGDDSRNQIGQVGVKTAPMCRWRHFRIMIRARWARMIMSIIFMVLAHATPSLEILEILDESYRSDKGPGSAIALSLPAVFPHFSNLKSFSTNLVLDVPKFLHRNPAFTGISLRSLSLVANPTTLRQISRYPNLSHLAIFYTGPWDTNIFVILPQLTSLTVDGDQWDSLITAVQAPNLQRLRFSSNLAQSFPMSSLLLTIRSLEWDVLFEGLDGYHFLYCVFALFKYCPRLQEFTMWAEYNSYSPAEFGRLVKSRLNDHPHPSLKSVTLLRPRTGDFDHADVDLVISLNKGEVESSARGLIPV
ncbi:hypothetical protein FRC17_001791 [Serendipita sp. 399]|nr:hypothetical protein FRC17_001791 [Serendipita sp. 399]